MTPLHTARLDLRPLRSDDAPFILKLLNQPSFLRFIGDRQVRTLEQAREYIEQGPLRSYAEHGFGLLLVCMQDSLIGLCGLVKRDYLPHPDIGFALLPEFESLGYATEAAQAVVQHTFETIGITRILAIVQADNVASLRLLKKLGMRDAGTVVVPESGETLLLLALDRDSNTLSRLS